MMGTSIFTESRAKKKELNAPTESGQARHGGQAPPAENPERTEKIRKNAGERGNTRSRAVLMR
jgi:hypothetical protein